MDNMVSMHRIWTQPKILPDGWLQTVIDDMEPEEGLRGIAVLMSGLGATPVMELYVLYDEVEEYLKEQGL